MTICVNAPMPPRVLSALPYLVAHQGQCMHDHSHILMFRSVMVAWLCDVPYVQLRFPSIVAGPCQAFNLKGLSEDWMLWGLKYAKWFQPQANTLAELAQQAPGVWGAPAGAACTASLLAQPCHVCIITTYKYRV